MRVFVVGTGRCGTVTFSKACSHITNYTSGHETNTHGKRPGNIEYPDNHIEVDPRLSYSLSLLKEKYKKDTIWVHLQRERDSCIKSLSKRKSLEKYAFFHWGTFDKDWNNIAAVYYDNTTKLIHNVIPYINHYWLHNIKNQWKFFWNIINAKGDFEKSIQEFDKKYNKSK